MKREIAGAVRELDDNQIEIYKKMSPAQKFYQAVSITNLGNMVQKINLPERKNNGNLLE